MISELVELNKDKMSYSFRHMPLAHLPGHETSAQAALIAEAAAEKGLFFEYLEAVYDHDNDARVKDVDQLIKIAAEIGLNTTGLDERIKSAESSLFASMTLDTSVAIDAGITQTPTFILIMKGHPTKAATAASMARLLGQEPYRSYLDK
jgi:predicted DsbA family dithiol-disulfide isomerase